MVTWIKILAICVLTVLIAQPQFAEAGPKDKNDDKSLKKSDLNKDGVVDLVDLEIFSKKHLKTNVQDVDWCAFYDAVSKGERFLKKKTKRYQKDYKILLGFIYDYFSCGAEAHLLDVANVPRHYARLAIDAAGSGRYFISDPIVGSVFIFEPDWALSGELKNLDKPLGVAIDTQGYLLVGNDSKDRIEVYDPETGDMLASFGEGVVEMPTAISLGPNGEIYVTDSRSHKVHVFEQSYVYLYAIGMPGSEEGQLRFPVDTVVISRDDNGTPLDEVFVADQGNHRIVVFNPAGDYLRTIDPPLVLKGWCVKYGFGCPSDARGTFNRIQALDTDEFGRLHVLDAFEAAGTILDAVSGSVVSSYGLWGDGPGYLRVPMDVLVTGSGQAIVTDADSNEIETFVVPAP